MRNGQPLVLHGARPCLWEAEAALLPLRTLHGARPYLREADAVAPLGAARVAISLRFGAFRPLEALVADADAVEAGAVV